MASQSLSNNIGTLRYVADMVQAFKAFDSDNDGLISAEELGGIMGSLGYTVSGQEVTDMMRRGDTDRDGMLSIEEFLEMNTSELGLGNMASLLESSLEALDGDDEAPVTGEELYEVLSCMGSVMISMEECMDIIASMDGDGDGAVNLEDFRLIVQALL